MVRKTNTVSSTEKLHRASAEAAQILGKDLAAYSAMLRLYLEEAGEEKDQYERDSLLETAGTLVESMAKLGGTIGRLRGELRQHIQVERNAHRGEMVPESARNPDTTQAKKPMQRAANIGSEPPKPRGEGV